MNTGLSHVATKAYSRFAIGCYDSSAKSAEALVRKDEKRKNEAGKTTRKNARDATFRSRHAQACVTHVEETRTYMHARMHACV